MKAGLLLIGGIVLLVIGWLLGAAALPHAWLAAVFTLLGWPLGSMALLLIHALTGGRWGEAARLPLLLGVLSLPFVLLLAIPIGLFMPALYPWTHPDIARVLPNLFYLNMPFLVARIVVYVVVWAGLAIAILLDLGVSRWAPLGLILLALTATFASFDATLALDPHMSSSIYGMLVGTGMVLFALSAAMLLALPVATGRGRDDLGKLLLALCVLWAYLDFVQFLVIWSSNLAADTPWFERRFSGFWFWALWAMAALHTIAPLFILAIPRFRRSFVLVLALTAALVLSGIVRGWWLVLPEAGRAPGLIDIACMAGVAAAVLGAALLVQRLPMLRRRVAYG